MARLVFFDVDKTLIKGHSGFYTVLSLMRHGVIRKRRLAKALWFGCFAAFYFDTVLERMYAPAIADMAGRRLDDVMAIGRRCMERWIWPLCYREALTTIADFQQRNVPVVLLSSGPYMTIRALGERLGATESHAIGPAVEDGILMNRFHRPICYKEGKLTLAQQIAARYETDLDDCAFYTDSIADRALLEAVGKPIMVNPDAKLRSLGAQRGWPAYQWRGCVGENSST